MLYGIIYRLRENDPKLLAFIFEAKLEAEEKFSALPVFEKYMAELYSD